MIVVPAILTKDLSGIKNKLRLINSLTDNIQIDVIDSWPAGKNTVSVKDLAKLPELKKYKIEFHLMVKKPINYLKNCALLKPKTVIGQVEYMDSQENFINECHRLKMKAGLALDLPSFLSKIDNTSFFKADHILLMAVPAGGQGRKFSKNVLAKLKRLVRIKKNLAHNFSISIDGGINHQTAKWCVANGANQLCVGSALLKADNIKQAWQELSNI